MSAAMPDAQPASPAALREQLLQMMAGPAVARALYVLAELGVADLFGAEPLSADTVAAAVGADADALCRVLRLAAGLGLFEQLDRRSFALTPLGAALRSSTEGAARAAVRFMGGPFVWQCLGDALDTVRRGHSGRERPAGHALFDHLDRDAEQARLFNQTMIGFHGAERPAVAAAYDFSQVKVLMDVGGGTGNLLTTVLERHPHLKGLLYDLPGVAAQGRELIAARGLADRCQVLEGSFFERVPEGADACLLSHILHDWTAANCRTILGHCRQALRGGGRLLLVEQVIPDGGGMHPGKLMDFYMLAGLGGMERTAAEYRELLAQAGFTMTRVVATASAASVVEAVPA